MGSFPASNQRQALEMRLLKLFLQLIVDARSLQAKSVQMEPSAELLKVSLYGDDPVTPLKETTLPAALSGPWLAFLLERVSFWPDLGDELFASNANRVKRLLVAPATNTRMMCDFVANRKPGAPGTHVSLLNIQLDNVPPVTPLLLLSPQARAQLDSICKRKTGVVLVPFTNKPHFIDATAVLLANRPDAHLVKNCTSEKAAMEALEAAQSHLVVVGIAGDDPVEMLGAFRSLVGSGASDFAARYAGSFLHYRVRRVCGGCARSTPIDPRTLDRLPMQLRPRAKNTYSFGRGCDACGHSAYRGTVGISSVLCADDSLSPFIASGSSTAEMTRVVYSKGTQSVLEDGLSKIFGGFTSFEEVFAVSNKISGGFAAAIAAQDSGATGEQGVSLEGIDGDALLGGNESEAPPPSPGADSSKKRILIVEDDYDQRIVLESIFRTEGYEVFAAENGQVALQKLGTQAVDVVVCDVMMPVMNGAQFIKHMRANAALKTVPVLMLTAVSNPDAECALLSHGADDYCEKNVKRKILLTRVERLLSRAQPKMKNPLGHMLDD